MKVFENTSVPGISTMIRPNGSQMVFTELCSASSLHFPFVLFPLGHKTFLYYLKMTRLIEAYHNIQLYN